MGILNEKPAVHLARTPLWKRAIIVLGSIAVALAALMSFPPAFESARMLLTRPISSALASDGSKVISPGEARKLRLTDAINAVNGSYVKDPYGCIYMFEYIDAKLTLTPILNDRKVQVCSSR